LAFQKSYTKFTWDYGPDIECCWRRAVNGVKQEVMRMIGSLPEDVTIDDIMAELYFRLQVDAGLKELDDGGGIPHEEVEKRMAAWLTH
jgi:hypothetical protein